MNPLSGILDEGMEVVYLSAAANPAFELLLTYHIEKLEKELLTLITLEGETGSEFKIRYFILSARRKVYADFLELNKNVIKHTQN